MSDIENKAFENEDDNEEAYEDYVTGVDEDGNEITLQPLDYFFYNGEEYCVLTEVNEDDFFEDCEECPHAAEEDRDCSACEEAPLDCFICKVIASKDEDGNDVDEFIPVEDDALAEKLIEIANTRMDEDEEADE